MILKKYIIKSSSKVLKHKNNMIQYGYSDYLGLDNYVKIEEATYLKREREKKNIIFS